MLVNWKVEYTDTVPADKQPPDYVLKDKKYWFFRYFPDDTQVDVVDVRSFPALEQFEKNKLRFYVWQTVRILGKLKRYDVVLSHGMQSGIVLCLWRRLFGKGKYKHIVFDIGAFNSAREEGGALKLMQFCSKTLDGVIYHTSGQKRYYDKCHPWLRDKARFIPFGTDTDYFRQAVNRAPSAGRPVFGKTGGNDYILCIGYSKRDWETLLEAFRTVKTSVRLRMIGNERLSCEDERVQILPVIPIGELVQEIRGSLFGVLPLQSFNYSYAQMTLQEQMTLGKAVVTADVPSLKDYVSDSVTAVLYEPGNARQLAEKITMLLENPEERDKIGKAAAHAIEERFHEKKMALEILSYIREVVK